MGGRGVKVSTSGIGDIQAKIREAKRAARRRALYKFRANKGAVAGAFILGFMLVLAVLGPYIAPEDPYAFDLRRKLEPPSWDSPFGRDELGRDILSRIIVGARYSIGIALASVFLGSVVGVFLGLVSGYYGRVVDSIIQRITDVLLAFPIIILSIALIAVMGVGVTNLVLAIGISTIPVYIRLVRGLTLQAKSREFVIAARAMGKSGFYIMRKHILPHVLPTVIVQSSYYLGFTILIASGLGFLGLGVKPPTPEWGAMLGSGRTYLFSYPHVVTFPGIFILLTALAFNLVGDGLRDALDPRAGAYRR